MQFEPENYRDTGFGDNLKNSLQQLAVGIGGQLQQRKQRQETFMGLKGLFPKADPENLKNLSNLDPNMLVHLLSPRGLLRQSLGNSVDFLTGQRNQNTQGQQPQEWQQQQTLRSLMGQQPQEMQAQESQQPQEDMMSQLMRSLQQTTPENFAQNKLDIPSSMQPNQGIMPEKQQQPMAQQHPRSRKKLKKLTDKLVDAFLKKSGNDPKKARELAALAGFEV